jgi:hypothetical protein
MFRNQNLQPIVDDGKTEEIKFLTVDIEAHSWINHVVSGFYDIKRKRFEYSDNLNDLLFHIVRYCSMYEIENVFAHNGGKYDFNFFLQEFLFDERFIVSGLIPRGSGLLCFTVQEREPAKLFNGEGFKVCFRDSLALLPFGLAKLAKAMQVKVQKGNIDYHFVKEAWENKDYRKIIKENPDKYKVTNNSRKKSEFRYINLEDNLEHKIYNRKDLLMYLEDDLVSLAECLEKFYSWEMVQKAGPSFTTAAQSVKVFQTFIKEPVHKLGGTADDFVRRGYFGGRTEVFKPIFDSSYDIKNNPENFTKEALKILKKQKGKKLNYYDVNSLYPTVMKAFKYPNKSKGWTYRYCPKTMGFWECEVEVPKDMFFPPLGVKHEIDGTEKLVFPTGKFKGVWSTYEIEYAKTLGIKVLKTFRGITFEDGGYMFKDFIDTLYNMRLEAKKKKDGVNDLLTKLMMNSCYGRFGLNVNREGLCLDDGSAGLLIHSELINPNTGETVRLMKEDVVLEHAFTNVAIAAYVTAYARILMHKIYLDAGPEHTFYTDTDSIFTTKEFKTGDKLGELKLEYTTKSAVFLLPKTYINEGVEGEDFLKKVTMKGFDKKKIKHFTIQDFRNQLRGEIDSLMVNQEAKFATLKTALQKGMFLAMNFDGDTNIKVDKKKLESDENELAILEEELIARQHDKKEDQDNIKIRIQRLKSRISGRKRKLKSHDYHTSVRSIKSRYDKREIILDGFDSKPLELGKEEKQ